jgi:hypothetical protein
MLTVRRAEALIACLLHEGQLEQIDDDIDIAVRRPQPGARARTS